MIKFEIGQRVGTFCDDNTGEFTTKPTYSAYSDGSDRAFGKVIEVLARDKVKVLFDKDHDYLNENVICYSSKTGKPTSDIRGPRTIETKYLLSEDEVKAKFSTFESDFKVVEKQVKEKLTVAAKAIREAQKLAKKELGTNVSEMYNTYDSLYRAMDAAGWRTSSFGC